MRQWGRGPACYSSYTCMEEHFLMKRFKKAQKKIKKLKKIIKKLKKRKK